MSSAHLHIGDVHQVLATLPDNSIDLVFTSPPFLALRSYLPPDHPDKNKEIGSENSPAEFLDTLLDVVESCARVLTPTGTLCFELGDTYSGSGGAGGDYNADGLRAGQQTFSGSAAKRAKLDIGDDYRPTRTGRGADWPLAKSLTMIPELFAASLSYGANLLRPERPTPPWRIRNFMPWCRPNPPVGAIGDKFRPATSFVTVACTSGHRWLDLDAVRNPNSRTDVGNPSGGRGDAPRQKGGYGDGNYDGPTAGANPGGAPPLDWLLIPTAPYAGAHYATFPPALVVPFVKAMCPPRVCRTCGEPSWRITAPTPEHRAHLDENLGRELEPIGERKNRVTGSHTHNAETTTLGWTDCGHDNWRPGVVLDPFAGSGTTLAVATGHARDAIGIDLDERNIALVEERVGRMFLTITNHTTGMRSSP